MVRQGTKRGPAATAPWRRRIGGLFAAVAVAGLIQVTGLPGLSDAGFSGIEEANAQRARREKPRTKASKSVGKRVGERLLEAQELMGEERYAEALSILNRLLQSDMKDYERAIVLRTIGSIHSSTGDYDKAIASFEQAQRLNALDEAQQLDLLYFLGQLYLAEGRVDEAIRLLERWFAEVGDAAAPGAYFTLASAYASKEDYRRALEVAERGLAKARLQEGTPRENWFRFVSSMRYLNQDVKGMQTLLREMVGLFPGRRQNWNQLYQTYFLLNDETTAYYFRIMMYIQDMVVKSKDLANLASLHIINETPIRGARILEKGYAEGLMDTEEADNYETLSIAYQEAREWKKSIKPLGQAAAASKDGKLYIRLCQAYLFDREYARAERACIQGINKGGLLRQAGSAWMFLGTARYNQGKLKSAREAFVNAARYERNAKNAQQWIRFIDNEIKYENARKAAAGGS